VTTPTEAKLDSEQLLYMYRTMVRIREFEESAGRLAEQARIPGAVHHPMGAIDDWWEHLPRDRAVIVQCHTGARSARVVQALTGRGGMDNVHNLTGGIVAWAAAHHPTEPGS